jgi:hypothetical protein
MDISDIFGQGIDAYGAAISRENCPYPSYITLSFVLTLRHLLILRCWRLALLMACLNCRQYLARVMLHLSIQAAAVLTA